MASKIDLEYYLKVQSLLSNADLPTLKKIEKFLSSKIKDDDSIKALNDYLDDDSIAVGKYNDMTSYDINPLNYFSSEKINKIKNFLGFNPRDGYVLAFNDYDVPFYIRNELKISAVTFLENDIQSSDGHHFYIKQGSYQGLKLVKLQEVRGEVIDGFSGAVCLIGSKEVINSLSKIVLDNYEED